MMKIREAVKCVPVILGYFLLTEIGKMKEPAFRHSDPTPLLLI